MSKKAAKIDELSELLQDEKILNSLVSRVTTSLMPMLEIMAKQITVEVTKEVTKELTITLSKHMEQITLEALAKSEEQISELKTQLKIVDDNATAHQRKVEEIERHERLSNLIFYGISEPSQQNTSAESTSQMNSGPETENSLSANIIQICQDKLKIVVTEQDISSIHRLPGSNKMKSRPVIVCFVRRRIRDRIFQSRKLLRSSKTPHTYQNAKEQIYINEHLTRTTAQTYARARKLLKEKQIASAWTAGGTVYIKATATSTDTPQKVLSIKDLDKYDL